MERREAGELDISPAVAAWIKRAHDSLDRLDLFELLGVDDDVDAATLRRAYQLRSKQFHPDRYFGKRMGPYRAMLERIFGRLADAFRELNDEQRRAAYRRRRRLRKSSLPARAMAGTIEAAARLERRADEEAPPLAYSGPPRSPESPGLEFVVD